MEEDEYKVKRQSSDCSILSHADCDGSFLAVDKEGELFVCTNCSWAKLHIRKEVEKK